MQKLVLGSTSPFRKAILDKLGLPFATDKPDVDESRLPDEAPEQLVARLSEMKARAVGERHPDALVIGSDQVAVLDGEILGKPGVHENAVRQLSNASGKTVTFLTGLCLLNTASGHVQTSVEAFEVSFRELRPDEIENYLQREQPYNCAGSFKSEALGITLFKSLHGDDPNTLIGLPLIRLAAMLREEGMDVLG